MPTSPTLTSRSPAARPLAVPAAVLVTALAIPAALAAPAHAEARPPAKMSPVGGAQLGEPGTQVKPKKGAKAPKLPRKLTSRSWIVSDAESGQVLASHNAHWKLAPASTMKMLFADTVLPKFDASHTHKVVPEDLKGMGEGSSLVGVKEGETYQVRDLWRGVFLRSGNDAVHVLSAMNGGVDQTVRQMRAHAKKLNAKDTHVLSPDGYDAKGQVSSAYDLSLFARSGLQKKDFRDYASTAQAQFPAEAEKGQDGKKKKRGHFSIQNTNKLLTGDVGLDRYPGIAGVKNGTTTNAGSTFTGVAQHGDRVLLVTCMHPKKGDMQRVYKETAKLFDWGFKASGKVTPVGSLVAPGNADGGPGRSAGDSGKGGADTGRSGNGMAAGKQQPSGGMGTALGVAGGCVALLALIGFVVHRRWPLPGQLSRLRRRPQRD